MQDIYVNPKAFLGHAFDVVAGPFLREDDYRSMYIGQTGMCVMLHGSAVVLRFADGYQDGFNISNTRHVKAPPAAPIDS